MLREALPLRLLIPQLTVLSLKQQQSSPLTTRAAKAVLWARPLTAKPTAMTQMTFPQIMTKKKTARSVSLRTLISPMLIPIPMKMMRLKQSFAARQALPHSSARQPSTTYSLRITLPLTAQTARVISQ